MKETLLYGLPKDATERYEEVLLLTNATSALIERVKAMAAKDGFHSFRVAEIDLGVKLDFTKGSWVIDKAFHGCAMTAFALFLRQWRERNELMVASAQQAKAGVNLPLEKRTA